MNAAVAARDLSSADGHRWQLGVSSVFEVDTPFAPASPPVTSNSSLHPDVAESRSMLESLGLGMSMGAASPELDNAEYGAAVAQVGSAKVRYRVGKITPRKVGAFVAVWRRAPDGSTEPFPAADDIDLLVIAVREGLHFGQFVLPKAALVEHGIVSTAGRGGKRGFRLYPSWSVTTNTQAQRTQRWQSHYFLHLNQQGVALRARRLFNGV